MNNILRQSSIRLLVIIGALSFGNAVYAVGDDRSATPGNRITNIETMGMIESVDHGLTWHFKGHAQLHAPALNPVDPSVMFDNGKLVLYYFDLHSLAGDTSVVYVSEAADSSGLDFTPPQRAFAMYGDFTDPAVVKMPGGTYRMYLHSNGIISASSTDGRAFVQDTGIRTNTGGVPGALVLPNGKVRLFVCGQGITSLISDDGLAFTAEAGIRIPLPSGAAVVADPHPILCSDGIYRMAYKVRPSGSGGAETDRVYLAGSADGYTWVTWTADSSLLVAGSVPTLVELPDGRLRIYYVDFQTTPPAGVFRFVKSVQVTPDSRFHTGSFSRVNYVPATDHLVVTFGTKASTVKGSSQGAGYAYKEYTLDMEATGKADTITWNPRAGEANDSGSRMVENSYYFAHIPTDSGLPYCWRLTKYDAATWTKVAQKYIMLKEPSESNTDMSVACLGGVLDISDQYNPTGIWQLGGESHHHFFTLDLDSLGTRILADTPHISGASMISAGGITYFLSADIYGGDLIVMKYDLDWHYLGAKKVMPQANWPQGVVFDGQRFYVAYLNTSQRSLPKFFPVFPNVHLAAFDLDWNLLEDVSLTDFTPTDYLVAGRPWIIQHGNRLYVSFDVDALDQSTLEEMLAWQAVVNIYEIQPASVSVRQSEIMPTEFRLDQNYPNPFNPSTTIRYGLSHKSHVSLKVFNTLGQQVALLVQGEQEAGYHEVTFDGSGFSSGMYFYRLTAGSYVQTRKLLLIR